MMILRNRGATAEDQSQGKDGKSRSLAKSCHWFYSCL
jgi:hypothetical protein